MADRRRRYHDITNQYCGQSSDVLLLHGAGRQQSCGFDRFPRSGAPGVSRVAGKLLATIGPGDGLHPTDRRNDPGQSTSNVVAKAKELSLFVVFGMTEKDAAGLLYNANVFLGPAGVIGKHRKTFHVGNDGSIWSLSSGFEVLASPLCKIGLMICAEMALYPGPALAGQGADLLVTSSAWWTSVAYNWDLFTVGNAVQSKRWHVVSQQVGTVGHVQVYGHSRVVNPKGTIVCDTGATEGLVIWATDIMIDAGR